MAAQPPNIQRLSDAFVVVAEESKKFSNLPAIDQGIHLIQALERLEHQQQQMQQTQQQMQQTQQQMQQTQQQMQQTMQQMQETMQQMSARLGRLEIRVITSYVLELGS